MVQENSHIPETAETPPKTSSRASGILQFIKRSMYHVVTGKLTEDEALHPDFRIESYAKNNLTWYQNRVCERTPRYKVGFPFNDLSILDNCPWVAKFGNNTHRHELPDFQYYFIGFGDPKKKDFGLDEMIKWAKQFPHYQVLEYGTPSMQKSGRKIQMLNDENTNS